MSFTLEISCKKCDHRFDYIEVGIGSTHPVCLCSKCNHTIHPKRKLLRRGWFCKRCKQLQRKEDQIDLYKTPMYLRIYKCPNNCGCDLEIENYMHSLHAIPSSFPAKLFHKTMIRISQYF